MEVILPLLFWVVTLLIYLICAIPLRELKGRGLDETSRAVWVLAIIAIPIMGALAFWIMQPGEQR